MKCLNKKNTLVRNILVMNVVVTGLLNVTHVIPPVVLIVGTEDDASYLTAGGANAHTACVRGAGSPSCVG